MAVTLMFLSFNGLSICENIKYWGSFNDHCRVWI